MAKSIRDGFSQLDSALARIAKEPRYLENDRARFDRTPSPIASPNFSISSREDPEWKGKSGCLKSYIRPLSRERFAARWAGAIRTL